MWGDKIMPVNHIDEMAETSPQNNISTPARVRAAQRRQVELTVKHAAHKGRTCDETAALMGMNPNDISGRFTELERKGDLIRLATTRLTRKGKGAYVYVHKDHYKEEKGAA